MKSLIVLAVALVTAAAVDHARAFVNLGAGNSARPSIILVNATGSTVATIRYRISVTNFGAARNLTSPFGRFVSPGGTVFASGGGVIAEPIRIASGATGSVQVLERVRIPRSVIRLLKRGQAVVYRREFTDEETSENLIIDVALRLSSSGLLSFRRLELRFDDETRYRIVNRDSALKARAVLVTVGSGVLRGAWEVTGPALAAPVVFRRLRTLTKTLTGGQTTVFESPNLPTDRPGLYTVRFVLERDGASAFNDRFPELRYFVKVRRGLAIISLLGPKPGASIGLASVFRWPTFDGAVAYRIEFRGARLASGAAGRRVAAVDLPSRAGLDYLSVRLRPFTWDRLSLESAAYWRVIAFGPDRRPIASSAFRRIGAFSGLYTP